MSDDKFTIHASRYLRPVLDRLMERPFSSQRWGALRPQVLAVLKQRAEDNGTSPEHELRRSAWAALSLEVPGLQVPARLFDPADPDASEAAAYVYDQVKAGVQRRVTEDLLGPGRRRHLFAAPDDEPAPSPPLPDAVLEATQEFEALLAVATDRERSIIEMIVKGDTISEAADKLGITAAAARQALWRARRRYRQKKISPEA